MRRLLAGVALVALLGIPGHAPAVPKSYVVTWTLTIVKDPRYPLRQLTGFGRVDIWTYERLLPNGHPPPLPQTLLYSLDIPVTCAGRERCVLATLPIADPDILRRVIVSSWIPDAWPLDDAASDVQATVTTIWAT